jgi:hypothetical protein
MKAPPVGSLVVPSPEYRATMGTGEGAAVLTALKRGSAHLYYCSTDRGYWVTSSRVRQIPLNAVPDGCLERLLAELLLFLEAEGCVVEEIGKGSMTLAVDAPGANRERLHELESRLASQLANFSIEPGSMRAVVLHLELVDLPMAADAAG